MIEESLTTSDNVDVLVVRNQYLAVIVGLTNNAAFLHRCSERQHIQDFLRDLGSGAAFAALVTSEGPVHYRVESVLYVRELTLDAARDLEEKTEAAQRMQSAASLAAARSIVGLR